MCALFSLLTHILVLPLVLHHESRLCLRLMYSVIQNDCRGHTQYTPDVTPCDFFLWGCVKDQVYVPPLPASILN